MVCFGVYENLIKSKSFYSEILNHSYGVSQIMFHKNAYIEES